MSLTIFKELSNFFGQYSVFLFNFLKNSKLIGSGLLFLLHICWGYEAYLHPLTLV